MPAFKLARAVGVAVRGTLRVLGDVLSNTGVWSTGNISVAQGASGTSPGQFNVAATGPADAVTGGVYDHAALSAALPVGMTLAPTTGVLDVGSATDQSVAGVQFTYLEPGAYLTLTLHPSLTGTFPYMATWFPTEGAVPNGYTAVSNDDSTLRGTVLSRWPDSSAQVIVLAGHTAVTAGVTKSIRLRAGQPSGADLTTTYLASIVNTVAVNFGAALSLALTASNHERVWWANPQVICARYRLPITNKGSMEAVIDVHAFANGRAFVEVVVENCKMNAALTNPTAPAEQTYTNAIVSVNGAQIQGGSGVSSTWGGGSTHRPFRSWYCSGWVGGDPQVEVTHDIVSLQAHPIFFKNEKTAAYNFATWSPGGGTESFFGSDQPYAADLYVPWTFGRQRWQGMGGTGGSNSIGPFPVWECQYIQSGDKNCRRAVIANALALYGFPINYRDTGTGFVPSFTQISGKRISGGYWPYEGGWPFANYDPYGWDYAHQPAAGLMAFMCRPSPCFIELSQKIAVFAALGYGSNGKWTSGQVREKAWNIRNVAQAAFLTPDGLWDKSAIESSIGFNASFIRTYEQNASCARLNLIGKYNAEDMFYDEIGSRPGYQQAMWQQSWLGVELARAHNMKILATTDQTNLGLAADWVLGYIVRMINECTNGEWRYLGSYYHNLGSQSNGEGVYIADPQIFANWSVARNWNKVDSATGEVGPLLDGSADTDTFSSWTSVSSATGYTAQMYAALAMAAERDFSGAAAAWSKFSAVTNLTTFRNLAANDARWMIWPRNK